ncbi:helix-turn-helix domain-containing protein [Bacillus cereus]|nr:helix-turn-helix domain-containing protein [Bacillus cereus]
MERPTLTAQEAATYLGVSLDLVNKESLYGSLSCVRIDRRKLFREETLNRWMTKKEMQCMEGRKVTNI